MERTCLVWDECRGVDVYHSPIILYIRSVYLPYTLRIPCVYRAGRSVYRAYTVRIPCVYRAYEIINGGVFCWSDK